MFARAFGRSSDFRFKRLSNRALSIGVSVKLTSSETMIANDIVSATLLKNRPGMLCINATGRKITTSESVVAMTARPISLVASIAASNGLIALLLDVPEDVFEHHDRVVDDDADRKRQAQHRRAIERDARDNPSPRRSR